MKTSVIRHRVADFLKQYAPFDALAENDLLELAGSGRVKFHQANEYVFRRGDPKAQTLWVVQQGRVDLLDLSASGEQLRDVLGEGDLLGLERFTGDGSCLYSARTTSDVILYGVSAELFTEVVQRYPVVERFLAAHFSTAGIPVSIEPHGSTLKRLLSTTSALATPAPPPSDHSKSRSRRPSPHERPSRRS